MNKLLTEVTLLTAQLQVGKLQCDYRIGLSVHNWKLAWNSKLAQFSVTIESGSEASFLVMLGSDFNCT